MFYFKSIISGYLMFINLISFCSTLTFCSFVTLLSGQLSESTSTFDKIVLIQRTAIYMERFRNKKCNKSSLVISGSDTVNTIFMKVFQLGKFSILKELTQNKSETMTFHRESFSSLKCKEKFQTKVGVNIKVRRKLEDNESTFQE